jgi:hypothetical protein
MMHKINLDNLKIILPDFYQGRSFDSAVIVDITGVDSIAALCKVIDADHVSVIPTIVDLSCEYSADKWNKYIECIDSLNERFNSEQKSIYPCIVLNVNTLWKAVVVASISDIISKYGFYTPCIACHYVFHASRIQLAKLLNIKKVVSGERELHGKKEKINQYDFVLDFYNQTYISNGIKHIQPIREISDSSEINSYVQSMNLKHVQIECLFSGNYYKTNTTDIEISKEMIREYLVSYLMKSIESLPNTIDVRCSLLK